MGWENWDLVLCGTGPSGEEFAQLTCGALETRMVNVTKATSKEMYINNLLTAIMEKWPAWEERVVKIQLDNAPVHPRPGRLGERLNQHLAQLRDVAGWDIDFVAQL